jgi:hypothetical protein
VVANEAKTIENLACTKCGVQKPKAEFYSKAQRLDSRCKECIKRLRRARYKGKHPNRRTTTDKVVVRYVEPEDPNRFLRELEAVELIFENLIYDVLSKRLKPKK